MAILSFARDLVAREGGRAASPAPPATRRGTPRRSLAGLLVVAAIAVGGPSVCWAVRVKDIASIEGARSNQLSGYGLVVGLGGTGDSQQALFTPQTVLNLLRRRGLTLEVNPRTLQVRNAAAVMVTASLPAFARQGNRIEAQVSSMGDAKSLQGGTLVLTPLFGPDGQVYAVAQGALSLGGGFAVRALGASAQKSHPTVALLADGAIVEREVPVELGAGGTMRVALFRPDFTTAERVSFAVNDALGRHLAQATDAGTIAVDVNGASPAAIVDMVTAIEQAEVTPDTAARVVLNERTGTVIIGHNVRLLPVAIAHGSLQVTVKTDFGVSQPAPFSDGETVVVPDTTLGVEEGPSRSLVALRAGTSLGDLVTGLNALGVTPQDLIAILQAVRAAGALQADLEIM
jgi:flagellar P-ring protein FlgI